jgi:hypothetical protein
MLFIIPSEFNSLPDSDKYALLEDFGVYLDQFYITGPKKICLFSLFHYYVEVYYQEPNDKLSGAFAFDDYGRLDPFLTEIDLASLYAGL